MNLSHRECGPPPTASSSNVCISKQLNHVHGKLGGFHAQARVLTAHLSKLESQARFPGAPAKRNKVSRSAA